MHPLIDQGLTLALYGMSTVFVLLTLLVFSISGMSQVLRILEYTDEKPRDSISRKKRAALVAAVLQYRKSRKIR